jgi:hypothetical protein
MVILRLQRYCLLFLASVIWGVFATVAFATSESCLIVVRDGLQLYLLPYDETIEFSPTSIRAVDYSVSPDQRYLLVEQHAETSSGKQILLYDITLTELIVIAQFEDMGLIRGGTWTSDSSRFALQDGYNNRWITLYTIDSGEISAFALDYPDLEVFQVTWNPDSERVAFVATEFAPSTGTNLMRLYVANEDSLQQISLPDEDVGWYFDKFVWLNEDELMYVSCESAENCHLNIANVHDSEIVRWDGKYDILRTLSTGEMLLLRYPIDADVEIVKFDTTTMEFEVIGQFSQDLSLPTIFSLSPDETYALIMPADGSYSLFYMQTGTVEELPLDDFNVGTWNLDGDGFLVFQDNFIYDYQIHTGEMELVMTFPDDARISPSGFICYDG